jgi:predicted ATP-dependent serine protease
MTKYIKADCGFHYSEKGGACSKCAAHPAIAAKVSSMKRNKIKYIKDEK